MLWLPHTVWGCSVQITGTEVAAEQSPHKAPQNGWTHVALPDLWKSREGDSPRVLWYRISWVSACTDQPVSLAVDRMVLAAQVFFNGDLLWQDESLQSPLSRSWNMPRYWLLPMSVMKSENTLLFRVVSERHPAPGLGNVWLGDPQKIQALHKKNLWQQRQAFSINMIISLVIACLFLVIWLMRPKERALGWFGLSSLLWTFGIINMFITSPWPFELGTTWDRLSLITLIFYNCTFAMFAWSYVGLHFPRLTPLLWGSTIAVSGYIALAEAEQIAGLQFICTLLYRAIFNLVCLGFVVHVLKTRKSDQLLLGLCMLIFLLLNTYDLLAFLGLMTYLQDVKTLSAPLGSLVMFIIVAWRFVSGLRRIESFNEELQLAVGNTRDELTRILKREYELESANIRLNERLRLTHDLHDSMGSSLMRSIILTEQNRSLERSQFLSMLKELRNDLRHVIDGSSSVVSADSSTPSIWIAPLRRRFSVLFDELDVSTVWRLPEQWPFEVDAMRLLALTRFLEEALTNVLKHSRCTRLEIDMQPLPGKGLTLSVKDNGCGFDPQQISGQGQGIGMNSMRMRIERIGGNLAITSRPGETQLTVTLREEAPAT
ncbi:ATP-binding protein [Ectopseudomonas mendocina]|uniref:histidine kinase n=1 Tax=Ectopseudomonas mendocina TaxID=300 RepID=A0ABZ2RG80_ECTME